MQSVPGTYSHLVSGFWVRPSCPRRQRTQVAPHRTPAVFILGAGGALAVTLLRDDLFKACFGSEHASAVLLAAFPSNRTPVVAATAGLVPLLLYPTAALGRPPPWRMKLQSVLLVAAFLVGVSSAACTRLPPSESVLASLRLPAWSSVHSW